MHAQCILHIPGSSITPTSIEQSLSSNMWMQPVTCYVKLHANRLSKLYKIQQVGRSFISFVTTSTRVNQLQLNYTKVSMLIINLNKSTLTFILSEELPRNIKLDFIFLFDRLHYIILDRKTKRIENVLYFFPNTSHQLLACKYHHVTRCAGEVSTK